MADKQNSAKAKKPSAFSRMGKYFRDVWGEFKKIVWPSRKQIINNTIIVLVTCIAFAVVIWGLDVLFAWLRGLVL
ncbi:MAG: preprotein translocase subunit SecE [Oscillospiraceae bacterium]